ncbi:MAG: ATP-dependent endonuclease [Planctomycetota bacterium]
MHLASLQVEDFRGMTDLLLPLDPTTVLVGENRVGKTTLVDAVDYCLRPSRATEACPFVVEDFRRDRREPPPIRLTLEVREDRPGEWDAPLFARLAALAVHGEAGVLRQLRLRLTGWLAEDGPRSEWCFLDRKDAPHAGAWDVGDVVLLRRLLPCLVLGRDRWDLRPEPAPGQAPGPGGIGPGAGPPDPRQQVAGIYRRASQTRGRLSRTEVLSGLEAARALEAREPEVRPEPPRDLREMIETPRDLTPLPSAPGEEASLSAQNLALLLLVGALLEARGDWAIPPEAAPIVMIEEPEAHLHPILAASLWGTLERLRAQKLITTHSAELLAAAPLSAVRRLTRRDELTRLHRIGRHALSLDDLRRVGYHVRIQRGASLFARCWLLVEGETESWLLPELARMCGYVLASEGVACIEFAQCGVRPVVKLAAALGIEWHLLADGDYAGERYVEAALSHLDGHDPAERVTRLDARDVEHCFWRHGYERVFLQGAFKQRKRGRRREGRDHPDRVIHRALRKHSKPFMALRVIEAAAAPGSPGVPPPLARAIHAAVWLARRSAGVPCERPRL